MEVLVRLPEDLYKYFEYIPVESLPEVILSLARTALQEKLESGLEEERQPTSDEMLMSLLNQISTIAGNTEVSTIIQKKVETSMEVTSVKQEDTPQPTVIKYVLPSSDITDEDDLEDFFK